MATGQPQKAIDKVSFKAAWQDTCKATSKVTWQASWEGTGRAASEVFSSATFQAISEAIDALQGARFSQQPCVKSSRAIQASSSYADTVFSALSAARIDTTSPASTSEGDFYNQE
jgi:hypothetical protein